MSLKCLTGPKIILIALKVILLFLKIILLAPKIIFKWSYNILKYCIFQFSHTSNRNEEKKKNIIKYSQHV